MNLQDGEVRQLQFFDNTLMALWSPQKGSAHLLDIPFQPISAQRQSDLVPLVSTAFEFVVTDPIPSSAQPSVQPTILSLDNLNDNDMVKHVFAASGSKSRPIRLNFYGRKGRKAVCVLYGDAMRYEVLSLDAAIYGEEDEEDAGEE